MKRLGEGPRVQIAPYRNGRFFYHLAFLDGSHGVVRGVRGTHAVVDVERPEMKKELPMMALRVLEQK